MPPRRNNKPVGAEEIAYHRPVSTRPKREGTLGLLDAGTGALLHPKLKGNTPHTTGLSTPVLGGFAFSKLGTDIGNLAQNNYANAFFKFNNALISDAARNKLMPVMPETEIKFADRLQHLPDWYKTNFNSKDCLALAGDIDNDFPNSAEKFTAKWFFPSFVINLYVLGLLNDHFLTFTDMIVPAQPADPGQEYIKEQEETASVASEASEESVSFIEDVEFDDFVHGPPDALEVSRMRIDMDNPQRASQASHATEQWSVYCTTKGIDWKLGGRQRRTTDEPQLARRHRNVYKNIMDLHSKIDRIKIHFPCLDRHGNESPDIWNLVCAKVLNGTGAWQRPDTIQQKYVAEEMEGISEMHPDHDDALKNFLDNDKFPTKVHQIHALVDMARAQTLIPACDPMITTFELITADYKTQNDLLRTPPYKAEWLALKRAYWRKLAIPHTLPKLLRARAGRDFKPHKPRVGRKHREPFHPSQAPRPKTEAKHAKYFQEKISPVDDLIRLWFQHLTNQLVDPFTSTEKDRLSLKNFNSKTDVNRYFMNAVFLSLREVVLVGRVSNTLALARLFEGDIEIELKSNECSRVTAALQTTPFRKQLIKMESEARRDKEMDLKRQKVEQENAALRNKQTQALERQNAEARKQLDIQKRQYQQTLKDLKQNNPKEVGVDPTTGTLFDFKPEDAPLEKKDALKPEIDLKQKDYATAIKNGYACPPRPAGYNGEFICISAVRGQCKKLGSKDCGGSHDFTPEVLKYCYFKCHSAHTYQPLGDEAAKAACDRVKKLPSN